MSRNWTPQQLDAINARGNSIIVSAAAGSGKTSVLVERVLRLLTDADNPVPANRIIVVTYTDAAANEMRQRLIEEMGKLIEKDPNNALLHEQSMLLTNAHICTIHSFCLDLIRDNFQELNIEAGFRICDEVELEVMKKQAIDEVFEEYYELHTGEMAELVQFFGPTRDYKLEKTVLQIHNFLNSIPFPDEWLNAQISKFSDAANSNLSEWIDIIFDEAEFLLSTAHDASIEMLNIAKLMQAMKSPQDLVPPKFNIRHSSISKIEILGLIEELIKKDVDIGNTVMMIENDITIIEGLIALVENKDWEGAYEYIYKFQRFSKKELEGLGDALHAIRENVKNSIKSAKMLFLCSEEEVKSDMGKLYPILKRLVNLTMSFSDKLTEIKTEKGVIDFSDFMHFAVKLLTSVQDGKRTKSALAKELSDYYEYIIIDEFQDVNDIQDEIFRLLSREEKNIFIVGDVKQSVYRFNQANPDILIKKKDRASDYPSHDKDASWVKIFLSHNFRSRVEVTDTVNYFFNKLMSKKAGEIDYDENEHLIPSAQFEDADDRNTEICIIRTDDKVNEDDDTGEPKDEITDLEIEAKYVADRIRQIIDSGYEIEDKGVMRPCRYSDISILMRSPNSRAPIFIEALLERGIPAATPTQKGYFDSREIMVVLNLLKIVDNPLRDIEMVSVMMSPMFMFTAEEMAEVRLKSSNSRMYFTVQKAAEDGNSKCDKFLQILNELREYSASHSIERFIRKIYDTTDLLALIGVHDGGEQKQANLRLLVEYANKYESYGTGGLSGFIRYVDDVIEQKSDFEQANVISPNENAVSILSIHKSKGLEYPICIVSCCGVKFNLKDTYDQLLLHINLGFGVKIREHRLLKLYPTLQYNANSHIMKMEQISEEMRLLYVALTRAREKLIITFTEKKLKGKLLALKRKISSGGSISPKAVLSCRSFSDWILLCMLEHKGGIELRKIAAFNGAVIYSDGEDINITITDTDSVLGEELREPEFTHTADDRIVSRITSNIEYSYPNSALCRLPSKLTVTEIVREETNSDVLLSWPAFMASQGMTGAQRGEALHKFMQFADYRKASISASSEIERLSSERFISTEEAKVIDSTKVDAFFNSELAKRILSSENVLREYKFMSRIHADEYAEDIDEEFADTEITIQGIADCIFEEDGELILLDYKTDYVKTEAELVKKYGKQLELYSKAIGGILEMNVKESIIYSFSLGKEIILNNS